jgi:hypothetical protein
MVSNGGCFSDEIMTSARVEGIPVVAQGSVDGCDWPGVMGGRSVFTKSYMHDNQTKKWADGTADFRRRFYALNSLSIERENGCGPIPVGRLTLKMRERASIDGEPKLFEWQPGLLLKWDLGLFYPLHSLRKTSPFYKLATVKKLSDDWGMRDVTPAMIDDLTSQTTSSANAANAASAANSSEETRLPELLVPDLVDREILLELLVQLYGPWYAPMSFSWSTIRDQPNATKKARKIHRLVCEGVGRDIDMAPFVALFRGLENKADAVRLALKNKSWIEKAKLSGRQQAELFGATVRPR